MTTSNPAPTKPARIFSTATGLEALPTVRPKTAGSGELVSLDRFQIGYFKEEFVALRSGLILPGLVLVISVWSSASAASLLSAGVPDALPDTAASRSLAWIQTSLSQDEFPLQVWNKGWLAFDGAYFAYSAVAALQSSRASDQAENWLNAGVTLACAGSQLLSPLWPAQDANSQLRKYPEATPEERREKLSRAEAALAGNAAAEDAGRAWWNHAVGVLGGAAIGVPLWFGYQQKDAALRDFALMILVNEAQIFTQTTRASRDWEQYRGSQARPGHAGAPALHWQFVLAPNAAGIRIDF